MSSKISSPVPPLSFFIFKFISISEVFESKINKRQACSLALENLSLVISVIISTYRPPSASDNRRGEKLVKRRVKAGERHGKNRGKEEEKGRERRGERGKGGGKREEKVGKPGDKWGRKGERERLIG